MPLPTHLSPVILAAGLNDLTPLLQKAANTDEPTARSGITALLADYNPQTNHELTLAADILRFQFMAADSMKRSTEPDLPLTHVQRLRSGAVAMSREAHKTKRELDKLQAARKAEPTIQEPAAEPDQPPPTQAELKALQVARDIMNGQKPHKHSPYGGNNHAEQLKKRALTQIIRDKAARNAQQFAEKAALQIPAV